MNNADFAERWDKMCKALQDELDLKESRGKPPKDVCDECHKIFWLREAE